MDIGEAMALTNSNNNWMNNPFMYLIWLAFFLAATVLALAVVAML